MSAIVYYVVLDDPDIVKIGTTQDPRTRMNDLGRRHRIDPVILAARPGSYDVETAVHDQWAGHRVAGRGNARELFRLDDVMHAHIDEVRVQWPDWRAMIAALDARGRPARRLTRRW